MQNKRCWWCGEDPLYREYHDKDWGVPVVDDQILFEMIILEGAQAGLSWLTILRKRRNYRNAFHNFSIAKVAAMGDGDLARCAADEGIVRNKLKIASTRKNARAALRIIEKHGSLAQYLWRFVDFRPQQNSWRDSNEVPSVTPSARVMSKEMKRDGFAFVGPTICYAFMQSVGMVNDHLISCFRHEEIKQDVEARKVEWLINQSGNVS
jgi:DNA-3-methyladenine glycosylase I